MQYEFEAGDTEKPGRYDKWEAGIDHKTPQGGTNGVWYQRIGCIGDTEADADALRDRVLDALQDEGKLDQMKDRAEKAEGLIRMLAINVLSFDQLNALEPEELQFIEAIIKMPGLRNDS